MAITPLNAQAIPEIRKINNNQQSNGSTSATNTDVSNSQSQEDLDAQIQDNKSQSMRYQIIDKMLVKGEANQDSSGLNKGSVSSRLQPLDDSATFSSASLATLSAERLEIQQSANQVRISQQSIQGQSFSFSQEAAPNGVQKTDPLAFDLDGNGLETTGVENGVSFDIDGDGTKDQTSFVSGADAFLAYDKNGNGVIDSGKELFGDQNGAANGYEELKKYDDNRDGKIDSSDAIYDKLQLLRADKEGNQTLTSLGEAGIKSIDLNYTNRREQLNLYDSIEQSATFTKEDGTQGKTGDLLLGHK